MPFTWILNPITLLSLLAVAMVSCLFLFVSLKREVVDLRRSAEDMRSQLSGTIDCLARDLERLEEKLVKSEREPSRPAPVDEVRLTRREQALHMFARGESPGSIATTLQAPRSEIELVLKVAGLKRPPQ
ncbi:MAG: hypothetical protein ABI693_12565 [Bryobacteraceae bacterium]